ncbi:MAG: geranylgeranyl reductase family protein [Chloroflexi bacterium]|nr:geranylgeranyl reductase family protein [Chloroflexota bacterium]
MTPEILVIGAGPGGSAAAWSLAAAGHDVLMVDAATFPRDKTCGDGLPPMAIQTMRHMGVIDKVEAAGAARIDTVSLTAPRGTTARVSFAGSMGEGYYALVLRRTVLDDVLRQHAAEAGAAFMGGTRVTRLVWQGDTITAVHAGQTVFSPQKVIIAVGANMGFLKRNGFLRSVPPVIRAARSYYAQVSGLRQDYSFFFDADLLPGYGWVFPTGPDTANIGIGVAEGAPRFNTQSTQSLLDEFVDRLVTNGTITNVTHTGNPKGYPIRIDFPTGRIAGQNWAIVGEATGLVNPATGEGIDLAMASGLMAAEHITSGRDLRGYGHQLRRRYKLMFDGLRFARDHFMTRRRLDYVVHLMTEHPFVERRVVNVAQGFESPAVMFHPLLIALFFMPISPRTAVRRLLNYA